MRVEARGGGGESTARNRRRRIGGGEWRRAPCRMSPASRCPAPPPRVRVRGGFRRVAALRLRRKPLLQRLATIAQTNARTDAAPRRSLDHNAAAPSDGAVTHRGHRCVGPNREGNDGEGLKEGDARDPRQASARVNTHRSKQRLDRHMSTHTEASSGWIGTCQHTPKQAAAGSARVNTHAPKQAAAVRRPLRRQRVRTTAIQRT